MGCMHRAAVLLDGFINYVSTLVRVPYTLETIFQRVTKIMSSESEVSAKLETFKNLVIEKLDGVAGSLSNVDVVLDAVLAKIQALIDAGNGGSTEVLAEIVTQIEAAQAAVSAKADEVTAQSAAVLAEAQTLAE